jgi:phospholipid/cholesterol/gamma-HCH transport system substrate-binding protein
MTSERSAPQIAVLALFIAACLAVFAYLYHDAGGSLSLSSPYTVIAVVPDAQNLVPNSDVRLAGVKIGHVVGVGADGIYSKVTMQLDAAAGRVHRDASVQVRTKTLVGESYVTLDPGSVSSPALHSGATLPLANSAETTTIDQVLSTFDAPTRRALQQDLRGLGSGLRGRGADLNKIFGELLPTLQNTGAATNVINEQHDALGRILAHTAQLMQALANRTTDVRTLAIDARSTAQAVAARNAMLVATFHALPGLLVQARSSLARLQTFSGHALPTVQNLTTAAVDLGPVVRDLRPAAAATRAAVAELLPFVRAANPLLTQLTPAAHTLSPTVNALGRLLRQANPAFANLAPYRSELISFFANQGAFTAGRDAAGNYARVHDEFSQQSLNVFTPAEQQVINALIKTGGLTAVSHESANPYPKPGTAGSPRPFGGDYPLLSPEPPRGLK